MRVCVWMRVREKVCVSMRDESERVRVRVCVWMRDELQRVCVRVCIWMRVRESVFVCQCVGREYACVSVCVRG